MNGIQNQLLTLNNFNNQSMIAPQFNNVSNNNTSIFNIQQNNIMGAPAQAAPQAAPQQGNLVNIFNIQQNTINGAPAQAAGSPLQGGQGGALALPQALASGQTPSFGGGMPVQQPQPQQGGQGLDISAILMLLALQQGQKKDRCEDEDCNEDRRPQQRPEKHKHHKHHDLPPGIAKKMHGHEGHRG